jgi:hypothetical protein
MKSTVKLEHHDESIPLEDGEITEDDIFVAHLSSSQLKPCKFLFKSPLPKANSNQNHIMDRTVTPHQLDQAKDIVLDLLGWGVTPEYLVDCGVSSQALYRIFGDLRLRLPKNIDKVAS